jgi:hypothetical protein
MDMAMDEGGQNIDGATRRCLMRRLPGNRKIFRRLICDDSTSSVDLWQRTHGTRSASATVMATWLLILHLGTVRARGERYASLWLAGRDVVDAW